MRIHGLWAISPMQALELNEALNQINNTPSEKMVDSYFALFYKQRMPLAVSGQVARIHVKGALAKDAPDLWSLIGNTTYTQIEEEISKALAANVKTIVFEFDTGGGSVSGCPELAMLIASLSDRVETIADIETCACSAGYYLASACSRIVASQSAVVGSVGVVMSWLDYTELLKKNGVEPQQITNEGATQKGALFFGSIDEAQRAFLQERCNEIGAQFHDFIYAMRPQLSEEVKQAGYYSGDKAVSLGLVDIIY